MKAYKKKILSIKLKEEANPFFLSAEK